jgi:hypothetical protein
VAMDSQETCDRMKAVCLENGLPIWDDEAGWSFINTRIFNYDEDCDEFFCYNNNTFPTKNNKVTEAEFLELLKEYKLNK